MSTALILAAVSGHFFGTVTYPYSRYSPGDDQLSSLNASSTLYVDHICYVLPVYEWFFDNAWYWIDFVLLVSVPFVVVLTGNCVMVTCVVRAVRFRYRQETHSAGPRVGGATAATGDKGKAVTSSTIMLMTLSVVSHDVRRLRIRAKAKSDRRLHLLGRGPDQGLSFQVQVSRPNRTTLVTLGAVSHNSAFKVVKSTKNSITIKVKAKITS